MTGYDDWKLASPPECNRLSEEDILERIKPVCPECGNKDVSRFQITAEEEHGTTIECMNPLGSTEDWCGCEIFSDYVSLDD